MDRLSSLNNEPKLNFDSPINYNNAKGLKRTLDSVQRQDYDDYEHIIVDGASTDYSLKFLKEYKKLNKSKSIVIISEPDNGIYFAMNKGISLASGDFIILQS